MGGYTGTVGGVEFKDGAAVSAPDVADPARLAGSLRNYFRRRGYVLVDGKVVKADPERPAPPDPRTVGFLGSGIVPQGTRLRDAAVDPRPGDFLPPTNAGDANPHGSDVVAPGLHSVEGVRPVRPGPVADQPSVQEVAETAHTGEVVDVTVERPAGNASREAWAAYATSLGVAVTDEMGRDQIRDAVPPED